MRKKIAALVLLISTALGLCSCATIDQLKQNVQKDISAYQSEEGQDGTVDTSNVSIDETNYYYSQLKTETERKTYMEIYSILLNKDDMAFVSIEDMDNLEFLYYCVMYDYPELFYVDGYSYSQYQNNSISFMPKYTMNETEIDAAMQTIEGYKQSVLSQMTEEMSSYDKEKIIYDYISANTEYVEGSPYNQSMYSVALGQSVCLGYSKMFQYLCKQCQIPCTIVTGNTKEGTAHGWNCVNINGNWYMTDVTNSTIAVDEKEKQKSYYLFNVTEQEIRRYYSIDNAVAIPPCNRMDENYYYKNGVYFDTADIDRFGQLKEASETKDILIKCSTQAVLDEICHQLIDEEQVYSILDTNHVSYMVSDDTLTFEVTWD